MNFQVFKYGMENSIHGIIDLLKGVKDDVAIEIRRMPDLVVYKDGKAHFIEVKLIDREELRHISVYHSLHILFTKNLKEL